MRRSMNIVLAVFVTCSLMLTVQHSILAQVKSKQESPPDMLQRLQQEIEDLQRQVIELTKQEGKKTEETITQGFSAASYIDTTIGKLLENEAARAILERHLPPGMLAGMMNHSEFGQAKALSFRQLAQYVPEIRQILTEEKLQAIDEDLTQLR